MFQIFYCTTTRGATFSIQHNFLPHSCHRMLRFSILFSQFSCYVLREIRNFVPLQVCYFTLWSFLHSVAYNASWTKEWWERLSIRDVRSREVFSAHIFQTIGVGSSNADVTSTLLVQKNFGFFKIYGVKYARTNGGLSQCEYCAD